MILTTRLEEDNKIVQKSLKAYKIKSIGAKKYITFDRNNVINNNILLVKLVENAIKSGFKKIFVVVGFRPNNIKKALKKFKNITFVNNNFYKSREMLFSIICGLKASKEDTIISYSDIIYDHNLLNLIKKSKSKYISLPVNLNWRKIWKIRKKNIYEDAETLKYDKNLKLFDIGKKLKKTNIPKSQFMGLIYIPKNKINRIIKYFHNISF